MFLKAIELWPAFKDGHRRLGMVYRHARTSAPRQARHGCARLLPASPSSLLTTPPRCAATSARTSSRSST